MKHKKLNYLFAVIFACGLAGQSAHAQPIAFESLTTELIKRADMDLPDGSTQQIDGGWLISSSGTDATYDPFGDHATFLYEEITGDFDRAVQIVSFDTLDPDGRGGIMVRESLDSISRVAKIAVSGLTGAEDENGVPIGRDRIEVMVRRDPRNLDEVDAPLGYSRLGRAYPGVGEAIPNLWIRVARHGNHFNYYLSENGSSWKLIGEDYFIGLPAKLFVGTYATTTTLESNVATVEFAGYRNSAVSDGVGPVAVSAGTLDKKVIGILFNEALASASVVPGNFAVTGATVAGARLGLGGESVYLDVTGLTADAFTVTINGVTDAGGNAISSNFNVSGTATAGWSAVDIGVFNEPENRPQDGDDPGIIGQTVAVSSGDHLTLEIVGGGSNIWNPGDFGHFVHKEQTGDFDIQVKVERFSNSYKTSTFGHSGLWIRNSLYNEDQENTPEGTAVVNYGNLTYGEGNVERTALAIWRDEAGGGYGNGDVIGTTTADDNGVTGRWGHLRVANAKGDFVEGSSSSASRWLRLKREGNTLTSMWSYDGLNWKENNVHESPSLAATAQIGFMEMTDTPGSPNSVPYYYNAIRISNFGNFVEGGSPGSLAFSDMKKADIKREDLSIGDGFSGEIPGGWTIDASGSDKIFDEFGDANHFVYEEIDGDFDRRVQMRRIVPQGADDRAGLMVRGGLESIAQVLKIAVSGLTGEEDENGLPIGRNRVEVMVRQDGTQLEDILNAPAGYSAISRSLANAAAAMPDLWLRISRSGNHFRMYLSNDGSTWNQIGERYFMGMPGKVFVGTYAAATTVDAGVVTADFTSYGPTNIADGSAPAVVSAGSLDKKIVGVLFSEPLASATVIPANFTVSGATVAGARLGLGGESVYLDVTGDLPNNFTVTINNVTDMAGNAIAANSQVSGSVTTGWTATDLGVFNDPENRPDPIDDPLFIGQTVAVSSGENLTLDIVGGGSNIWNPGDFGHIIYREHEGDFDMHVKVERFDNSYKTSTFGHAGLWIRNSLYLDGQENTADGTKVVNYGNLTYAEANVDRAALAIWRDEVGAGYGNGDVIGAGTADVNGVVGRWGHLRLADATGAFVPGSSPTASRWLRLMREGNTLTSMWSYDGVNWTQNNVHESPNLASTAIVGFMEMTDTAGSPNSNPNFYNAIRISNFSGNFGGSTGGDAEITSVALENGSIVIAFTGKLQSALSPTGPWTDVTATGTYSEPVADGAKFFRVIP